MKKILKLCTLCACVLIGLVLAIFLSRLILLSWFSYTNRWKYNAEFDNYEAEFVLVKDYVYSNFNGSDDWVSVSYNIEDGVMQLYSYNQGYIEIPDSIQTALKSIRKNAFVDKDANFDIIRIEENRVAFCIENGHYALIWSPNGKPIGLNSSDDGAKTHVKRINSEWYHVVHNPD